MWTKTDGDECFWVMVLCVEVSDGRYAIVSSSKLSPCSAEIIPGVMTSGCPHLVTLHECFLEEIHLTGAGYTRQNISAAPSRIPHNASSEVI